MLNTFLLVLIPIIVGVEGDVQSLQMATDMRCLGFTNCNRKVLWDVTIDLQRNFFQNPSLWPVVKVRMSASTDGSCDVRKSIKSVFWL